ncbi:hypothetical protein SLS58_008740 [Diplodia intermedia]|uniref:Uncharacterized protein n=1 Tax=Diplodia intermedia TaxID=856260 RepID=A0ABR3TGN1_9PEZI
MSEYDPEETDVSVQLLRQVHGNNPRLIDSLLRQTEPKLPAAMPHGNEQSIETLFENLKNEWEYEKEGNPGVFDATIAPKAKTAKDRELDADLRAMNPMAAKANKKVQKKQPKSRKTPKAPSTTIPPAIQPPSTTVPTRKSARLQKQSTKPTTTKSAASGTLSTTTIPDSDDDSSTSSLTSLSSSAISALRPTPPPSPAHQPAATSTLPPYPPIRGSASAPPIAYPTTATRATPGTLADGRTFHPRPTTRAIHPPTTPALADVQNDILDRALARHPRWPTTTTNARSKPDAVQYADIPALVKGIKDAVVRGDAFEVRVREESAWRDPETGRDERDARHVEEDVVEAWGERWGRAAERFFGRGVRGEGGEEAKRREGYRARARKGAETKRRNAEEAERRRRERVEGDERREKEKREKEKREKEKKEKCEKVEATASKGKRTDAEAMTSADEPKRGIKPRSQSTVADKPKHAMRPRTKSVGNAMEMRLTRATKKFMFDAGTKDEDAILNDDAQEEHDKSEVEDRQPAGIQTKRKRKDVSPGPLPQTRIKAHAQAAIRSATKPTPAMSSASIGDEDTGDEDTGNEDTGDEEASDEDSSYEGDTKVAIPSARNATCGPARPRANVTTCVQARTSPAPSKRKVSFAHISDGDRSGVEKTRSSPRKLRSSTHLTMPASQSKRRRTRETSSSSDEVTPPPPKQHRRLVSMKELKALRQMRESSSSSEEGAPPPKPRRRLVSMKDLGLQEAARSASDNASKAKHSVEQPESLPMVSSGDQKSQPSDPMPITDLELNDSVNSAHEDNKKDPLTETAPATQVLQSQAEPSNPAPCPSTSRSEAPAYDDRPGAHDATAMRSRSPVTDEERAHPAAARERPARTLARPSSTETSGSRTAAVANNSSSSVHAYKVTEGHSGEHDATTTTTPSPAVFTTPSPGEPHGSAVATRPGVDTASGAALEDSGITGKPEPGTGDGSGEQPNSATINYAEGAADGENSDIIVEHAEGATINKPSDTVDNAEGATVNKPSDTADNAKGATVNKSSNTIENAADAGHADGFGNPLPGEQTGSDKPDNPIIKGGVEYASQQYGIDTVVDRAVDPAIAREPHRTTSTVDDHDTSGTEHTDTRIGDHQAVVGEFANSIINSADAIPDRAEDSAVADIGIAGEPYNSTIKVIEGASDHCLVTVLDRAKGAGVEGEIGNPIAIEDEEESRSIEPDDTDIGHEEAGIGGPGSLIGIKDDEDSYGGDESAAADEHWSRDGDTIDPRPGSAYEYGEQNCSIRNSRVYNMDVGDEEAPVGVEDDEVQSSGPRDAAVQPGPARAIMGKRNWRVMKFGDYQQSTQKELTEKPGKKKEEPKILIKIQKYFIKKEPGIKQEPDTEEDGLPSEELTQEPKTRKLNKGKERQRDDALAVDDEDGNELLLTPTNFVNFERERNRLAAAHTRDVHNVWTWGEEQGVADLMNQGLHNAQEVTERYNSLWAGRRIGLITLDDEAWITLRRREFPEILAMMAQLREDREAQLAADHGTEFGMD